MKKLICLLIIMFLTINAYGQGPREKLKRGAINLATGWVEIPKNIYDTSVEKNKMTGMTRGLVAGIGAGVVRTGTGLYEMVTFTFPVPSGYKPMLKPIYVLNK